MTTRRRFARWAVGVSAALFAYLAYVYLGLPDVRPLVKSNPATTAFMELRAREATAQGKRPRRAQRWAGINRISPDLRRAVIITEDAAFWAHEGIDLDELRVSMELNIEERQFVRGASTITQQLAKNLYLSPSRNPIRKIRELIIARRLEAELTKTRILELYLNVIEWGDGIYGAEAAARTYFGVSAEAVGPREAALLAGAIINPRVLNPAAPNARLLARQRLILGRMGGVGSDPRSPAMEQPAEPSPDIVPEPPDLPEEEVPAPKPPEASGIPDEAARRPEARPSLTLLNSVRYIRRTYVSSLDGIRPRRVTRRAVSPTQTARRAQRRPGSGVSAPA